MNKPWVGQGAVLLAVIEEQSGNEIAVSILSIWGISLLLSITSPRHFPPGRVEVCNKEATTIDFCAPSLYLHLMGKHLLSSSSTNHERVLADTIPKYLQKTELERKQNDADKKIAKMVSLFLL